MQKCRIPVEGYCCHTLSFSLEEKETKLKWHSNNISLTAKPGGPAGPVKPEGPDGPRGPCSDANENVSYIYTNKF